MVTRPDDQTRWQKFWRRPSAGQRGFDFAVEFLRSDPSRSEWRDTMSAFETSRYHDNTDFDRQFKLVIHHYLMTGKIAGAEPAEAPVTFTKTALGCAFCSMPGRECNNIDLCPYFPSHLKATS